MIGLALGGGAALAISEIGTLQWLDEHHVPVDVIAGTSMGSILAAFLSIVGQAQAAAPAAAANRRRARQEGLP